MKWTLLIVAGTASFSTAFAASNIKQGARFNLNSAAEPLSRERTPQPLLTRNATTPNLFARFLNHFDTRQTEGRCGASASGARCPNNQCCSTFDFCGTDAEHCSVLVGCQPQYGRCGDAAPEPTPTPTPSPSPSPSSSSVVVPPSSSTLVPSSSSVLPPLPSGTLIISPNGQCGNVTTCGGSGFGSCCSEWYFCGSSPAHCGTGCRSAFGTCNGVSPPPSSSVPVPVPSSSSVGTSSSTRPTSTPTPTPSPSPTPTPTPTPTPAPPVPTNVSTNGRCGPEGSGTTCSGSTFGRCCSDYGWCGSSDDYCRLSYGCRPNFGTCG